MHFERVSLVWCVPLLSRFKLGTVELQPKLISSDTPGISDDVTASVIEIYGFFFLYHWDIVLYFVQEVYSYMIFSL